jgi:hypothetical protein
VHDPDEAYTEHADPTHGPWQALVVPVLKRMPRAVLAERTGLSDRAITAIRNGNTLPHAKHQDALTKAASAFARNQLRAADVPVPHGDLEASAASARITTHARRW